LESNRSAAVYRSFCFAELNALVDRKVEIELL